MKLLPSAETHYLFFSDGNLILNDLVMQNSFSELCDSAKSFDFDLI